MFASTYPQAKTALKTVLLHSEVHGVRNSAGQLGFLPQLSKGFLLDKRDS
jgi:hypothetical protein